MEWCTCHVTVVVVEFLKSSGLRNIPMNCQHHPLLRLIIITVSSRMRQAKLSFHFTSVLRIKSKDKWLSAMWDTVILFAGQQKVFLWNRTKVTLQVMCQNLNNSFVLLEILVQSIASGSEPVHISIQLSSVREAESNDIDGIHHDQVPNDTSSEEEQEYISKI